MRCKKHPSDDSSTVGVCASCLSQRLLALIAAQAQLTLSNSTVENRQSDGKPPRSPPPPLTFPRSVSPPYSRKNRHHHLLFYSTPQVGPTFNNSTGATGFSCKTNNRKHARFSLLSHLFRSRSDKFNSDADTDRWRSSSSPSWFSAIFSSSRRTSKKQSASAGVSAPHRRRRMFPDRGMSPDSQEDCDRSPPSHSGSSSESVSASAQWWKKMTPAAAPPAVRRAKNGNMSSAAAASGFPFCLSPLVRVASPSRHWNQKGSCGGGLPPEIGFSGDKRVTRKPHLRTASSFSANRSRKLCDLGRVNQNR